MARQIIGSAVLASFLLAACEKQAADLSAGKQMSSRGAMSALEGESREIARQAARVLAEALDVPLSTVSVDTVRAVDWPDSSIGCPQPGQSYLQVVTPGHKITLRVDGRIHTVHEARGRAFVCEQRRDPGRFTGQRDLVWGPMAAAAREDLAARLAVPVGDILIAGARRTTFPDAGLGCPGAGVEAGGGERDGFVLRLRYGSRDYTYHTDLERVVPCPPITAD